METYSIAQVEALTGIQAPTLRMWEKRYGFPIPNRTDTNIRFYSDEQLRKLLNVSVLIDAGYKISKVAAMPDDQLELASLDLQSNGIDENADIKAMVIHMLEYNEAGFNEIFQVSIIRRGLLKTMTQLIYPFLHHVGVLWGNGKVMPAQEHFISNLIIKKLFASIDAIPDAPRTSKKIILFLPEKEEHELGLLLSYFIFKNAGWRTYYLGSSVPIENVVAMRAAVNPDYLFTFLTTPVSDPTKILDLIFDNLKSHILLAGSAPRLPSEKTGEHFTTFSSPEELLDFIRNKN